MSEILKLRHYRQMHGESGRMTATTIYADICYTQERLIDYCDIVADSLIKYNRAVAQDGAQPSRKETRTKLRVHELFKDKYEMLQIGEDKEGRMIDQA